MPPRSTPNGFWHCGMLCPGSRSGRRSVIARRWLMSCGRRSRPSGTAIRCEAAVKTGRGHCDAAPPRGGSVDEVASAMCWQRHTVRGLFSGTLKKKLGLTVASAQEERGRVYRIAAAERA